MKKRIIALLLLVTVLLTACNRNKPDGDNFKDNVPPHPNGQQGSNITNDDNTSYGDSLESMGALDGFFEEELCDVEIKCISGTPGCYTLDGNVLIFTAVRAETVYSISGKLNGSIVIDTGDTYKFDLEFCDFSLVSDDTNPITVLSGDEVSIQAKKDTKNYIYDMRAALSADDTESHSGAIYSEVDLEIAGKGQLTVLSENNNGIHSKKDLQVKNLTLTVSAKDNALKGNDSVELENATATVIATVGDAIKTTNSDISNKGNQRGTVSVLGGAYNVYAACDGIDAAYDVVVDDSTSVLNIYTDKYSSYSEEVISNSESVYYIRFNSNSYTYSVKYYNSDTDYTWVNAEYHSTVSGGRGTHFYYSFPKNMNYSKLQFYVYSSDMQQGQDGDYVVASDYITPNGAYDTLALSNRNGYLNYNWTNYGSSSASGGPGGGMNDGNSDKGDHSAKGIKASNEVVIKAGSVNIKSYDDAIHAKNDDALENGATATGNLTIQGGSITLYSNDDGVHADGALTIENGTVSIINSYEGMEGSTVEVIGGSVNVVAKDDGINAAASSGTAIAVSGGSLYIYCGGDGLDSNSRTSYSGISFSGGKTLVISTSGGNSAIDSEAGYSYTGGSVVAIMPKGGMSNEATKCQNFSSVGKSGSISLTEGGYLICEVGGNTLTVNMPVSMFALVVVLGSSSANASYSASSEHNLAKGEFIWK